MYSSEIALITRSLFGKLCNVTCGEATYIQYLGLIIRRTTSIGIPRDNNAFLTRELELANCTPLSFPPFQFFRVNHCLRAYNIYLHCFLFYKRTNILKLLNNTLVVSLECRRNLCVAAVKCEVILITWYPRLWLYPPPRPEPCVPCFSQFKILRKLFNFSSDGSESSVAHLPF